MLMAGTPKKGGPNIGNGHVEQACEASSRGLGLALKGFEVVPLHGVCSTHFVFRLCSYMKFALPAP